MLIVPEIEFKEKFGPAKCWKCGTKVSSLDVVYEAEDMVGRPSFTKETFLLHPQVPQFCQICYEKIIK